MFYAFAHTVTADDLVTAKKKLDMILTAGIIHQVDVLFQKDCAHKINVQIFKGGHQLWPTNPGGSLKGDAIAISFREFFELKGASNELHALIWTTDAEVLAEVVIQIGMLPKSVIQPLSFDELVHAAAGL